MKDIDFLKSLNLPDTTIDEVAHETSGSYMGMEGLPPFVRVYFTMRPSHVSCIHAEIWLPDDWNGYFLGTGNGGMAGGIAYGTLGAFLPFGYAVVNTDMGTSGDPARGIGQPDVWEDFLCRSTHGMTVLGKEIVRAWYGRAETLSYFFGASTGRNQAMILAQRFPEDYDGMPTTAPSSIPILSGTLYISTTKTMGRCSQKNRSAESRILRCGSSRAVGTGCRGTISSPVPASRRRIYGSFSVSSGKKDPILQRNRSKLCRRSTTVR